MQSHRFGHNVTPTAPCGEAVVASPPCTYGNFLGGNPLFELDQIRADQFATIPCCNYIIDMDNSCCENWGTWACSKLDFGTHSSDDPFELWAIAASTSVRNINLAV
jgi:hypothetical protein